MKRIRIISFFGFLVLSLCTVSAQQYQSKHLQAAVERLGLDTLMAKMQPVGTHSVEVNGQKIVYRKGMDQKVEHIGLPLFHQSMRILQPSPIYDYLEYVTLDHKYHISENNLQQKELKFVRGSWAQLEQLGDTLGCTIQNLEDKFYRVKWQRDGQDVIIVTFPISYELLANSSRREMQANLIRDLKAYEKGSLQPFSVDTLSLQPTQTEGILMLPGQSHLIPKISSTLYVRKDKEGAPHLLIDNRQPAESMANLLVVDSETTVDAMIQLEFVLDNYRKDTLQVSLNDWKAFMRSQGCQPYFGYEGVSKGEATGTLLLANPQSGYDHILHVSCPTDAIGQEGMMLRATAYLFTPLNNVKALFGNPTSNTSRKSIIVWK